MKTKLVSVLVVLAILLLPLFSIVLLPKAYAADKNAPADAHLLDINTATARAIEGAARDWRRLLGQNHQRTTIREEG